VLSEEAVYEILAGRFGAIGRSAVEGHAHHRRVVLAHVADVLDVRGLQEGIDPGKVRLLAT
jgi:hypothetical protein